MSLQNSIVFFNLLTVIDVIYVQYIEHLHFVCRGDKTPVGIKVVYHPNADKQILTLQQVGFMLMNLKGITFKLVSK